MTEPNGEPQTNFRALLEEMDQAYCRRQESYQEFVESIQCHDRRTKADKWMAYTAQNIVTYGDQEALVYCRSRGHECQEEIDRLMSDWKRAAKDCIGEYVKGISIHVLETGETKREGGIPLSKASDVRNVSPYLLPNFWGGRLEQETSLDSTMLRTVDWCDIGGFEEWWERLARATREDVIQGMINSIPGSFWLFSMSRSDYAIKLMGNALDRALEAIELPLDDERYSWHVLREWDAEGQRTYRHVDHLPYASAVAFANMRLRSSQHNCDTVKQATETLLRTQHEDGSWPCWAEAEAERPSVQASAMCIHALVLARPQGWKRSVEKACDWLWSKQERSGCWVDPASPDPVFLSVLVLDALDLANGKPVTFRQKDSKRDIQIPSESSSNAEKRILLVSATANERQAILASLDSRDIAYEEHFSNEFQGHVFNFPSQSGGAKIFMVRVSDKGPTETGIQVSDEVKRLHPDAVLMVGMCMGLKGRVEKHDVLVPREIISLAHVRDTPDGPKTIPHFFRAHAMAHKRLNMILDTPTPQFTFRVHQKQLGCGPQKEENPEGWIVNYLENYSTDVLGYEMEAEGFYLALQNHNVEALFIKGVADFGNFSDCQGLSSEECAIKKKESQSQAVYNALDVALKWVEHFIRFHRS